MTLITSDSPQVDDAYWGARMNLNVTSNLYSGVKHQDLAFASVKLISKYLPQIMGD